jgi:predicted transcriptional regulator
MSVQISEEMKERLDRLSSATNRSPPEIAEEALGDYLAHQEVEIAALDAAVDRADRGDFVSHDAVTGWLTSWGTPDERPAPVADIFKKRQ